MFPLWRRRGARVLLTSLSALLAGLPLGGQTSDSEQTNMLMRVGIGTLNSGRYKEAEQAFRQLLEANPCHPRGISGLAEVYFAQKQPEEAVRAAESEVEKCSSRAEALQVFGDILLRADKQDQAAATYQRALQLSEKTAPVSGILHFRLAEIFRLQGDKDAWGRALDSAAETLKNSPVLLTSKALYQDAIGQKQAAMTSYREALRLEPNNGPALNNLAFLMVETNGDLDSALEMAKRASNLMPDSAEVADTLGWIYTRKRWGDVAILLLKSSLQKKPENDATRKHMLEALEVKDQGPAGEELKAALKAPHSLENEEKIKGLLFKIK